MKITALIISGKDTHKAIRELISNVEYEKLKCKISRIAESGQKIELYKND